MFNRILFLLASIAILTGCATTSLKTDPIVGTWNHEIRNLPRGEPKGSFTISKNGDGYEGSITCPRGTSEITEIVVSGNTLESGYFEAENYNIEISGTFEGDTFTGQISTQGYDFPMSATRAQ